jgi:FkbM family methyltransferase
MQKTRPGTLDAYIFKEVRGYSKHVSFEKTDRWMDAGANIGAFSAMIAPRVAHVAAFEPDVSNFSLLCANAPMANVAKERFALVGNADTERTFYLNTKKNKGAHTLLAKRGRDVVTVPATNINDALSRHGINKIKMDVEGAEDELLYAIQDWSGITQFVMEFHLLMLGDKDHSKYNRALALLRRNFKTVRAPEPKKNWHVTVSAHK